jgi:hypothetical protein
LGKDGQLAGGATKWQGLDKQCVEYWHLSVQTPLEDKERRFSLGPQDQVESRMMEVDNEEGMMNMQIMIKLPTSLTIVLDVQNTELIFSIKIKIMDQVGVAPDCQKLLYRGQNWTTTTPWFTTVLEKVTA